MDDSEILARIHAIVEAERELRASQEPGDDTPAKLHRLEESLDQCWDLLRQRRAHRDFDQNPDESVARPFDQVEGYLQ